MKHIVGIADMAIAFTSGDVIVTHALGSCLGVAVYDPVACGGGMLHVMMPESKINPAKSATNPFMFVDTGLPAFFNAMYKAGMQKSRMTVKVVGGANVHRTTGTDTFAIGRRNFVMLKKVFWKNGIVMDSTDVGGSHPRTMYMQIGSGKVWISTAGEETQL